MRTSAIGAPTVGHPMDDIAEGVSTGTIRLAVELAGIPVAAIVAREGRKRRNRRERERAGCRCVPEATRAPAGEVTSEEMERVAATAVAEVRAVLPAGRAVAFMRATLVRDQCGA